jgi:hypothetical protein
MEKIPKTRLRNAALLTLVVAPTLASSARLHPRCDAVGATRARPTGARRVSWFR